MLLEMDGNIFDNFGQPFRKPRWLSISRRDVDFDRALNALDRRILTDIDRHRLTALLKPTFLHDHEILNRQVAQQGCCSLIEVGL